MTARGLRGPNASIEAVVVRDRSEVSRRMQDANDANQIVQFAKQDAIARAFQNQVQQRRFLHRLGRGMPLPNR